LKPTKPQWIPWNRWPFWVTTRTYYDPCPARWNPLSWHGLHRSPPSLKSFCTGVSVVLKTVRADLEKERVERKEWERELYTKSEGQDWERRRVGQRQNLTDQEGHEREKDSKTHMCGCMYWRHGPQPQRPRLLQVGWTPLMYSGATTPSFHVWLYLVFAVAGSLMLLKVRQMKHDVPMHLPCPRRCWLPPSAALAGFLRKFWKRDFSNASESAFPGILGYFFTFLRILSQRRGIKLHIKSPPMFLYVTHCILPLMHSWSIVDPL